MGSSGGEEDGSNQVDLTSECSGSLSMDYPWRLSRCPLSVLLTFYCNADGGGGGRMGRCAVLTCQSLFTQVDHIQA